jgi:uncharacterized protein with HEPN domain
MPHDGPMLLEDVRRATALIEQFTAGRSLSEYASDDLVRAAVERQFITIGEALNRLEKLDAALSNRISDYRKIIGFRNILVHGYESIEDAIGWTTIQEYVPVLRPQVETLLASHGLP